MAEGGERWCGDGGRGWRMMKGLNNGGDVQNGGGLAEV